MNHPQRILLVLLMTILPAQVALAQAPAEAPAAPVAPPPDPGALLKVLPSDVTGFVAVPSLRQMDDHVQGVLTQLQLAGMVPGPLDWIRTSAGLGQGLNENGPLGFAVLSLRDAKSAEEIGDRLVAYIPAAKPEQLLQTLGTGEKDGDFDKITLMGQPTVAASIPGFLVAAEKPETLKAAISAPQKGIEAAMSESRAKAYAGSDIFVWADPRALSKELRAQLSEGLTELMGKMNPAAGAMAQTQPQGEQLDNFFDQVQEFTVGISADSQRGLVVNWFANPLEGTPLAKQAQNMKGVEGSLLAGLPNEPVIAALGMICGGATPEKAEQAEEMLGQVLKAYSALLSGAGIQIEEQRLNALQEPLVKLFTTMERFSMSVAGLPPGGDQGRLGLTMVAQTADAQAWQVSARKLFLSLKDLAIDTAKKQGEPDEKIKPIGDAIQWKEKAEQAEGAVVDHFIVDIDALPKDPNDAPEDIEKIKAFIGKEGVLFRVAALADNHVVMTFGGGSARFAQILELARKNDTGLSESKTLRTVAGRLPRGPRIIEGYLALDNLLELIMSTAAQFGQPIPIPLALQNAAPIVLTVTKVTDTSQETQVLVPMELMVSVKDLIGPIMMMMGGGMGAEPPPQEEVPPPPTGKLN